MFTGEKTKDKKKGKELEKGKDHQTGKRHFASVRNSDFSLLVNGDCMLPF